MIITEKITNGNGHKRRIHIFVVFLVSPLANYLFYSLQDTKLAVPVSYSRAH